MGQVQGVKKRLLIEQPAGHLAPELAVPIIEMGSQGQDLQPFKALAAQGRQSVQVQSILDEQIGGNAWLHGGPMPGSGTGGRQAGGGKAKRSLL